LGTTPHLLRLTFASLLFAIGEDPGLGEASAGPHRPAFTLRVYAHSMGGAPEERRRLRDVNDGYEVVGEATRQIKRHRRDPACGAERVLDVLNRRAFGLGPGARLPDQ